MVTHNSFSSDELPPPPPSSSSSYSRYVEEEAPPQWSVDWLNKLVSHLVYNSISLLFSPISSLFPYSNYKPNYHDDDDDDDDDEQTIQYSSVQNSSIFKKVGLGFLGAAHACMVLLLVAAVAVAVGVGLVRFWLEEPIFFKEKLHFDYTHIHPNAVYSFKSPPAAAGGLLHKIIPTALSTNKQVVDHRVPIGHTFQVSVALVMPESEYNRQVGVFQVTAEVVGEKGEVIAKSSEACMLRFRSLAIRVMRVFVLGVPVLLGISNEVQKLRIGGIVKHKEVGMTRSDSIRVTLIPRAGTSSPPQLYEADIIVESHLPFFKQILHRWKWTLYVWASMNIYMMMLLIMLCFCKPLILSGPPFILRSFQLEPRHTTRSSALSAAAAERWSNDHVADQALVIINRDDQRTAVAVVGDPTTTDIHQHPHPRRRRRLRPAAGARDNKVDDDNIQEKEKEISSSSEHLRRLQRSRSKRKAAALLLAHHSSASTMTTVNPNAVDDSESVFCLG